MRCRNRRVLASLALVAMVGGACGGDDEGGGASGDEPKVAAGAGLGVSATQSSISILRSNLTGLLEQHVFLTGLTTAAALSGGDPAPPSAVLDQNSQALALVVGAVYGDEGSQAFLDLWRRQVSLLLDFGQASAAGDTAKLDATKAALDVYRDELATFLNTANPQLAKDALLDDQKTYLGGLQQAITAQAKQDPTAVAKLAKAAQHMPRTAAVLAAGIAKQRPAFGGLVDGSAATLRAVLTSRLQEHAYLVWLTTGVILARGDSKPAADALDANSTELANVVSGAYGDAAAASFLTLWRTHIGFFVDYAQATLAADTAKAAQARSQLDGFGASLGAFLHAANPNLDAAEVAADLRAHTTSLLTAIDAQATGDASQFAKIQAAAGRMAMTAELLAGAIAGQFPARFS
ncbi:MAG: hypothetical protein ACRDZW_01380 [Acidimicrobiales bacterium]